MNKGQIEPSVDFNEIARILADGVKSDPFLSAILLIVVLVVFVVVLAIIRKQIGGSGLLHLVYALLATACVGMVCIVAICLSEIGRQRVQLSKIPSLRLSENPDTIRLADELTAEQKQDIRRILQGAMTDVAEALNVTTNLVRANLFGVNRQGTLRMIQDLAINMNRPDEFTLNIPIGSGSTGRCFESGEPTIAVFHKDWGENALSNEELKKVHPDLRWIISIPIRGNGSGTGPIWVMNIDGLKDSRSEPALREAMSHLFNWSYLVSQIIVTTHEQVAVGRTSYAEATNTPVARIYPITNIALTDIAPVSGHLVNATMNLKTVTPLNAFTKDQFNQQVQNLFMTQESPK